MFESFNALVNEPMSEHTTLKLGGPADYLVFPRSAEEIGALFAEAGAYNLPVTVIGHGSNLLVLDGGIRGLVICIGKNMRKITRDGNRITAQAGTMLGSAAIEAADAGLTGLEFASGIPGTVGGGVTMNAGAYDGEMAQVVTQVKGFCPGGKTITLSNEEMKFGYRHSAVTEKNLIVTEVTFELQEGDPAESRAKMSSSGALISVIGIKSGMVTPQARSPRFPKRKIQENRVNREAAVVMATSSPASSPSLPMFCAMVKDAVATGAAKIRNRTKRSTGGKPAGRSMAMAAAGSRISLIMQVRIIQRRFLRTEENLSVPPRTIRAMGVDIAAILFRGPRMASGSTTPKVRNRKPTRAPSIRGFSAISAAILRGEGFPPLNHASTNTAVRLNSGTMMATSMEAVSVPASPHTLAAIGIA